MKKSNKKVDIIIIIAIVLIVAAALIALVLMPIEKSNDKSPAVTHNAGAADYNGKIIGILTGSSFEPITMEKFPDSEYLYFNTYSDLNLALLEERIDGYVADEPTLMTIKEENNMISYISEPIGQSTYHFLFSKTDERSHKMLMQFNEMLDEFDRDGTLDRMKEIWFGDDKSVQVIDRSGLTGENGIINIGIYSGAPPFCMYADGEISGLTVDLSYRFAQRYGYDLMIEDTDISGMLSGLNHEKYDILAGAFSKTPEREEAADYSGAFCSSGIVLAVRASDISAGGAASSGKSYTTKYTSIEELNVKGRKIGVETGSSSVFKAEKYLPNAEIIQCTDRFSGFDAVRQGMYDAFVFDRRQMQLAIDNGVKGVALLEDNVGEDTEVAVGISKNPSVPDLKNKLNKFIADINGNGINEEAFRRWVFERKYEMPDIPKAKDPSFTLKIGTTGLVEPYSFYKDNVITGYDIEMAKRFAASINADLEIKIYDYTGIVMAVQSGEIDCVFANLNKTPEREKVIDFSDALYLEQDAAMVAVTGDADSNDTGTGFFESIVISFEKNFIRENRWQLILEGIATTCLITVMSAIAGSLLAFLICIFRRTGSSLANSISNIYVKLLQGTPMVVLLMILYYVILGKSELSATWVAIVGFSLNFGAYASEIMRSGIESVDAGQREAALALGYNENQAFFRFVFPQAAVRFLPVYTGEIISLLKGTSIVGYIAIQDLTKMGDIIRSRTYEAFFPLIATAVIYFILAWVISLILKVVHKGISPKRKKD